jgi:hypothetical protein
MLLSGLAMGGSALVLAASASASSDCDASSGGLLLRLHLLLVLVSLEAVVHQPKDVRNFVLSLGH